MIDPLHRRRSLPAGGTVEMQTMADGWQLRSLFWPPSKPNTGSILFLTGRADFAEKYAETFHDLVDAGWGVATFDWRGQGLSGRVGIDAMAGDVPDGGFDTWLADLDAMVAWFHRVLPPPWYAIGHSMGGHMLQRHLAGENAEFARAILLAPMIGLSAKPLGPRVARLVARLMLWLGRGDAYVFGGGPYQPQASGGVRQLLLTTDPERYADEGWWIAQNPALALGNVTWAWLAAAFASLDALLKPPRTLRGTGEGAQSVPALQRITTPLLVLMPDPDGLVDNDVTRRAVATMATARLEPVPRVGHELLREASDIRARVLARCLDFLHKGA
jgi:lysophospholipase